MRELFLPIRTIPKNSNVILYGAGKIGRTYYEQNKELQWCNIVAVADRNSNSIRDFPIKVIALDEICQYSYDYILIAIKSITGNKENEVIINDLTKRGVQRERILEDATCCLWSAKASPIIDTSQGTQGRLKIALILRQSSLGDHIISLKLYQSITALFDDGDIDIYSNNAQIANAIYYGQKYLRSIFQMKDARMNDFKLNAYDFIILFKTEPKIIHCNMQKLTEAAPKLAEAAKRLLEYQKANDVDLPVIPYENVISLNRARLLGKDLYSMIGCINVFDITGQNVDIFVDDSFLLRYDSLELSVPYITFSYGAGGSPDGILQQTKAWPKNKYEELIDMIKAEYEDISIVQLGKDSNTAVKGADKYVFNEEIGTVEYVLKNSLLHIDCESGLVHLATQLGTKCVVLFGPTPIWFFGYRDNINIAPQMCGECMGLDPEWFFRCYRYDSPKCMDSITPETVFNAVCGYLNKNKLREE